MVWGCISKIDPEALKIEYNGITFGERKLRGVIDEKFGFRPDMVEDRQGLSSNSYKLVHKAYK